MALCCRSISSDTIRHSGQPQSTPRRSRDSVRTVGRPGPCPMAAPAAAAAPPAGALPTAATAAGATAAVLAADSLPALEASWGRISAAAADQSTAWEERGTQQMVVLAKLVPAPGESVASCSA